MEGLLLIMALETADSHNGLAQPEFPNIQRVVDSEGDEKAPGILLFNGIQREKSPRIQKRPVDEEIKKEVGTKPDRSVDTSDYSKARKRHHSQGPV